MEPFGNFAIARIFPHRHVGCCHHRWHAHRGIFGIRCHIFLLLIDRVPDIRASRAFYQLPLITKQKVEIAIVPFCRIGCPRTFDTTGDGVTPFAFAMCAYPAKAHLFNRSTFWLNPDQISITCTMRFTECMTTCGQGDSFFVIHRHSGKCFTNIAGTCQRIGIAIRPFRIHIDQSHLHGRQRMRQIAITRITAIRQPVCFKTPVNIFFRCPYVWTTATVTKGFAAHRLDSDITCQNQKIGPANLLAIFLFDRP